MGYSKKPFDGISSIRTNKTSNEDSIRNLQNNGPYAKCTHMNTTVSARSSASNSWLLCSRRIRKFYALAQLNKFKLFDTNKFEGKAKHYVHSIIDYL